MSATAVEPETETGESKPLVQMPLFEGLRVNEHRLNFAGNILLTDPAVVKQMHLKNGEVELVIRAKVVSRSHKKLEDKEGNVIGAVSSSTVYVESVTEYDG